MAPLVVFDLDGTLTRQRGGFELLHTLYGTTSTGAELMEQLEAEEISFEEWCRATVETWRMAGITESDVQQAVRAIKPKAGAPGILSQLQQADVAFGIVSAGIANFATQFKQYDHEFVRGNWIQFEDEQIAGIDVGVGPDQKGEILRDIRERRDGVDITYIGDSHTDTEAFVEADTAVLFDPDERVPKAAVDAADVIIESESIANITPYLPTDRIS